MTLSLLWSLGCTPHSPSVVEPLQPEPVDSTTALMPDAESGQFPTDTLLTESWLAYGQRFIQDDGRVIDWENQARTVSEGQAYAMLRAVLVDDRDTFDRTLNWAENNLKRQPRPNDSDGQDHLWAWQWGERSDGSWGVIDSNFASDADIDAITALILAARRWEQPQYLDLARLKLADLWEQSTLAIPAVQAAETRYLLPGPISAFQPQPAAVYLNPSYLAPYAFRLFAQVDPQRDWMALVDSSYQVLEQTAALSPQGLPGDWVVLEMASRSITTAPYEGDLQSRYGFDAYRVWWRVAWDAAWFDEPRAKAFLEDHLPYLDELWQQQQQIPAVLDLAGNPLADYESTSQYAMLYPAFQQIDSPSAAAIRQNKLLTTYNRGIWDNTEAYYVQNLAWLGLFPSDSVPESLLQN